ncbi:hypothetical protein LAZ67_7002326 [Cordylochernes scorpioides]|uniref:Retrovirus-related Pol polyprotein from type-1 retrotransposable element R1 n=1 Tax=Cordylochernes scorpioides TaxID=51811 RepID=A0ABY6KN36_9ARAC|nr:hypothetical protein LAZ67_7002326 [Cordylochernes scorpioides]
MAQPTGSARPSLESLLRAMVKQQSVMMVILGIEEDDSEDEPKGDGVKDSEENGESLLRAVVKRQSVMMDILGIEEDDSDDEPKGDGVKDSEDFDEQNEMVDEEELLVNGLDVPTTQAGEIDRDTENKEELSNCIIDVPNTEVEKRSVEVEESEKAEVEKNSGEVEESEKAQVAKRSVLGTESAEPITKEVDVIARIDTENTEELLVNGLDVPTTQAGEIDRDTENTEELSNCIIDVPNTEVEKRSVEVEESEKAEVEKNSGEVEESEKAQVAKRSVLGTESADDNSKPSDDASKHSDEKSGTDEEEPTKESGDFDKVNHKMEMALKIVLYLLTLEILRYSQDEPSKWKFLISHQNSLYEKCFRISLEDMEDNVQEIVEYDESKVEESKTLSKQSYIIHIIWNSRITITKWLEDNFIMDHQESHLRSDDGSSVAGAGCEKDSDCDANECCAGVMFKRCKTIPKKVRARPSWKITLKLELLLGQETSIHHNFHNLEDETKHAFFLIDVENISWCEILRVSRCGVKSERVSRFTVVTERVKPVVTERVPGNIGRILLLESPGRPSRSLFWTARSPLVAPSPPGLPPDKATEATTSPYGSQTCWLPSFGYRRLSVTSPIAQILCLARARDPYPPNHPERAQSTVLGMAEGTPRCRVDCAVDPHRVCVPRHLLGDLRRKFFSGHDADIVLRFILHTLPLPDHPASKQIFQQHSKLVQLWVPDLRGDIADTSLDTPEKMQMATRGLMLTLVQEAELLLEDAFKGASLGRPNPAANIPIPSTSFASVVAEKEKPVRPALPKPKVKATFVNLAPSFESHVVVKSADPKSNPKEILREIQKIHPSLASSKDVVASINTSGKVVFHTKTTQMAKSLASGLTSLPTGLSCHLPVILPRYCLFRGKRDIKVVHRSKNAAHNTSTVFIEVDIQVAEILGQHGRIPVAGLMHRYERSHTLKQCFRCCGFGHRASACPAAHPICYRCGSAEHEGFQCSAEPSQSRCCRCSKKSGAPINHFATSPSCPFVNARKSPTAILEIANLAISTQADIVLLQELPTNFFWPTPGFQAFFVPGAYIPSGIVARSNLHPIPLTSPDTAITSIAICLEQSIIAVYSAYWHGLRAAEDFIPLLEDTIRRASLPVILGMDTNAHSPTWGMGARLDFRGANLEEFASFNDLHFLGPPVISTWSNGSLSSSIDVTLASSSLAIHATRGLLGEMAFTDHIPIWTTFHDMVNKETNSSWVESSCKEQTFKSFLNSSLHQVTAQLNEASTPEDIDRVVLLLTSILQSACDSSMRRRSNTTRPSKPWWTPELSRIRRFVISLRRYSQSVRSPIRNFFRGLYRACHNRLKAAIRKARSKSWFNLCEEVSSASWSAIHRFIARGRGSPRGPPLLKHDNGSPYYPHETCQAVLNYFFLPHPQRNAISAHSDEPEFKPWEVLRAIHRCGKRKAPGPDGLGSKCLDLGGPSLQFLLAELFTKCLRMGHFPRPRKEGRLILLPKPSNSATSQLEKYRPITLLNTMAKVFERCILARLQWLADRHGWFFEDQYGFVNGRSAEDALASITQFIEERQAHWRKTLVISLDISKAFDTVWRPAIIQNLERLNCPEYIIGLVKSFLEDRRVSYSAWTATECTSSQLGTPQGSALSPFLWNIVARTIFTLPSIKDSRLIAYADDFTLMFQVRGRLPVSATNNFLERLTSWCTMCGLNINPSKTQACLFQWRNVHPNSETGLKILGQPLNIKKTITILGVELDQTRGFVAHLRKITRRCISIIPRLTNSIKGKFGISFSAGTRIFDAVVVPALLYGASAWGRRALSNEGIRQLRSLHYNFAKRVLRGPRTPTVSAISITGSPPLDIIVRSRTAFLKEINEGNFESRPGPASLPYPPNRRQLSFSQSIEEITTPIIYTDGSKNEAGVGAAIFPSSEDQQTVLLRLHPDCSAFQAELLAIRWVVRLVEEGYSREEITIASDCKSALSAICTSGPVRSTLVAEIVLALNTNQNVKLCWVPGHCGIDGNERADRAAKNAAVSTLEPTFSILPRSLARNHSRTAALDAWTEVYCRDHSNRHLRRIAHTPDRFLQFLPKVRPGEVTTTLLTGHGHVRADLVLWQPGEDPSCPHCMEEQQTVDHLLFRCPAFMRHRMQTALLLGRTSFDTVSLAGLPDSLQAWNFLTSWFGPAIGLKRPDLWRTKNWLLHHDNAPAHTSLLVRDFLAKNNTLMMPQPPYSLDLAPCDFFLFPKLKRPMKGRRYNTLDEIKTASKEKLKKILKMIF